MGVRTAVSPMRTLFALCGFSDSNRTGVLGWDSVVVEGWSACFQVGFGVVFSVKICDFGELVLSEIALPSDL